MYSICIQITSIELSGGAENLACVIILSMIQTLLEFIVVCLIWTLFYFVLPGNFPLGFPSNYNAEG